ncbi:SDR family NAD(P)-dependent oxidoreductase [Curtobacterium sp. MCBD17_034]|uniref:SDR family NAD(P)-dependent oxidoreductase n=1 Tax=unclassified Curtobacterium TaxID=257496 RepID=UPI000DA8B870|nr:MULTISPECIES: SDR family oxidoreductase [unclassified Curtobacterium]PZF62016.1 SDR family NAD(P)-dependent oxidoreductase [Curtobacterium sp. MCBD17_034]PZM34050.1 SDR family NAD(P)-dependent oxidoreductase [Curtobacterium sp. MCBD17_031]
MEDLHTVRALVTGGTSGLGRAMAEGLVDAGARVAVTGRSEARVTAAAREIGGDTIGIAMDSRDDRSVEQGTATAWQALDGIDLLVNNAGIGMRTVNPAFMTTPQDFWEVSPDGFRDVVDTNLTGYFLVARAVAPRMLAAGTGRVVTISMNHGTMNRRGFVPYGPSRAGAEALARIIAADLAGTPVRANILLPGGATATGMLEGTSRPEALAVLSPDVMRAPIRWLASDEAADVHDERIVATEFTDWLASRRAS